MLWKCNARLSRCHGTDSCQHRISHIHVSGRNLHQWFDATGDINTWVNIWPLHSIDSMGGYVWKSLILDELEFREETKAMTRTAATCLSQHSSNTKPRFHYRSDYHEWTQEGIIINVLGAVIIALGVVISFTVRRSNAPATAKVYVTERL